MQRFNKTTCKHAFTHTWYLYPISVFIVSLVWLWGFRTYHQPTAHQKLTIFVAAKVNDQSCFKKIAKDHYKREDLREVKVPSSLPSAASYYEKLKVYLFTSDILILDYETINNMKTHLAETFVSLDNPVISAYFSGGETYYTYDTTNYAVRMKEKDTAHYLDTYMTFASDQDYYLLLGGSSKNLGSAIHEKNATHTNALTYMKYLLEGDL